MQPLGQYGHDQQQQEQQRQQHAFNAGLMQQAPGIGTFGGLPGSSAAAGAAGPFGSMGGGCSGVPGAQGSSYNPSSEILSMINKGGQNILGMQGGMGLNPALPQGVPQGHSLPQGLSGSGGLGLGMGNPQGDLGGMPMGGSGAGFDLSEFPSLGGGPGRNSVMPGVGLQQFRSPQAFDLVQAANQGIAGQPVAKPEPEFAIESEDFPALPGALGAAPRRSGSFDGVPLKEEDGAPTGGTPADRADRFGLMGLLSVIRMTDQDLNTLALGTDLTTLGLNLNSSDCLYATFASPWADSPAQRDPEFNLPQCYYMQPPALKTGHFSKFQLETLFYIFYNMPRDTLQAYAATELYNRDWRYHKDLKLWFTRASRQGSQDTQKGQYIYFDIQDWKKKVFHGAGGGAAPGGGADANDGDEADDAAAGMLHDS